MKTIEEIREQFEGMGLTDDALEKVVAKAYSVALEAEEASAAETRRAVHAEGMANLPGQMVPDDRWKARAAERTGAIIRKHANKLLGITSSSSGTSDYEEDLYE
jgi:hypothetical protein